MKLIKRFMSLALSLCMIMALCFCSFADDAEAAEKAEKTETLTITSPATGHTYKAYQLLKGDVSGLTGNKDDGYSGTLSNIEIGSAVDGDTYTADQIVTAVTAEGQTGGTLGNTAHSFVKSGAKAEAELSSANDWTASVKPGYYIIEDTYTAGKDDTNVVYSRYLVNVVGKTTVAPKIALPKIDKTIVNKAEKDAAGNVTNQKNAALDDSQKTDTAAIGDKIEYKIEGSVPETEGYTYYYYILNDTMSEGLDFDKDSVVVTIQKEGEDAVTLTKDEDYYLYTKEDGNTDGEMVDGVEVKHTFEVAFKDMKGLQDTYGVGAKITVSYSATVNKKAAIGTTANTNDVKLQYSNKPGESNQNDKSDKPGTPDTTEKDPTGKTPTYETKTYVTELKLTKVDSATKQILKGAQFTLTGTNLNQIVISTESKFEEDTEGTYYKLNDGTYTEEAPITEDIKDEKGNVITKTNTDKYESTTTRYKVTTETKTMGKDQENTEIETFVGEDGTITFTGLNAGTYTLTESVTPTGYNTLDPIEFTISATQEGSTDQVGGEITWSSSLESIKMENGTFTTTIENKKGTVLPSTGGIGTTIFYVIGSVMVLGAAVLLITKKRMSSEN